MLLTKSNMDTLLKKLAGIQNTLNAHCVTVDPVLTQGEYEEGVIASTSLVWTGSEDKQYKRLNVNSDVCSDFEITVTLADTSSFQHKITNKDTYSTELYVNQSVITAVTVTEQLGLTANVVINLLSS